MPRAKSSNVSLSVPIQDRSDMVMDLYVRPACDDDYEIIPAGEEAVATLIDREVFRHLKSDDLVVAYLGRPALMEGDGNGCLES